MKRIFISTDFDKLCLVIGDLRQTKGINLLKENDILYFNNDSKSFQKEFLNEVTLFLTKDTATFSDSKENQFGTIDKENDYLMMHSTCSHAKIFKKIHKEGHHEQDDPFYTYVFQIIFDDNCISKADKIIKFLFESASDAYRKIYKLLTINYIKMLSCGYPSEVSEEIKELLATIVEYFEKKEKKGFIGNDLIKKIKSLQSESDIKSFYKGLTEIHFEVDKILFNVPSTQ